MQIESEAQRVHVQIEAETKHTMIITADDMKLININTPVNTITSETINRVEMWIRIGSEIKNKQGDMIQEG